MQIVDLPVEPRDKLGSANSRRYRRAGMIPCILYGGGQENVRLVTEAAQFGEILKAHTAIVRLKQGDNEQTALIREVTWDTFGEFVEHIDLTRVELEDQVKIRVPVEFVGVAAGVAAGGVLHVVANEVEVLSRVGSIPSELRVDISRLEIGDAVHIGDLDYPESVQPIGDPRRHLVHVSEPKKVDEPAEVGDAEAVPGEGAAEVAEPASPDA